MVKFINVILEYPIISVILVPIIITIAYDVIKHKIINRKIDVFWKYTRGGTFLSAVSYGDSNAVEISTNPTRGDASFKAKIDLKNAPKNLEQKHFVMALVKYIPGENWKKYYRWGYKFSFDINSSAGILGVQLEIKDEAGRKLIDKYVETAQEKKNYSYDLRNYYSGKAWNNVGQICFTVFIEDKYVSGTTGTFEVSNCFLEIKK